MHEQEIKDTYICNACKNKIQQGHTYLFQILEELFPEGSTYVSNGNEFEGHLCHKCYTKLINKIKT